MWFSLLLSFWEKQVYTLLLFSEKQVYTLLSFSEKQVYTLHSLLTAVTFYPFYIMTQVNMGYHSSDLSLHLEVLESLGPLPSSSWFICMCICLSPPWSILISIFMAYDIHQHTRLLYLTEQALWSNRHSSLSILSLTSEVYQVILGNWIWLMLSLWNDATRACRRNPCQYYIARDFVYNYLHSNFCQYKLMVGHLFLQKTWKSTILRKFSLNILIRISLWSVCEMYVTEKPATTYQPYVTTFQWYMQRVFLKAQIWISLHIELERIHMNLLYYYESL